VTKHFCLPDRVDIQREIIKKSGVVMGKECWIWNGAIDKNGYGTRRYGTKKINKNFFAHRLSFLVFKGELKDGMQINHTCDNPSCVNPVHLYQGTQADNMADVKDRGRGAKEKPNLQGENHHSAKLTSKDVKFIREHKKKGGSLRALWKELFNHLSYSTILMAGRGSNWKYE